MIHFTGAHLAIVLVAAIVGFFAGAVYGYLFATDNNHKRKHT